MSNYHPPAGEKAVYRAIEWPESGNAFIAKCPMAKFNDNVMLAQGCNACSHFRGYRDDDGTPRNQLQRYVGPWWNRCATVLCGMAKFVAVPEKAMTALQKKKAKEVSAKLHAEKKAGLKGKDAEDSGEDQS